MPRHAKSTKVERDRGMLAGLKKHASRLDSFAHAPGLESADAVASRFQAHIDALDRVAATHAAWLQAVRDEESMEPEIKKLTERLRLYLSGVFAGSAAFLGDFGLKPRKKARMSVEKMRLTVEKRNATRKARGTMGKRQKKALRRGR
jgi:hypothetical protein